MKHNSSDERTKVGDAICKQPILSKLRTTSKTRHNMNRWRRYGSPHQMMYRTKSSWPGSTENFVSFYNAWRIDAVGFRQWKNVTIRASYDPVIDSILTLRDTFMARITIQRSVTEDASRLSDKLSNNYKTQARHQRNSPANSSVAISSFSLLSLKRCRLLISAYSCTLTQTKSHNYTYHEQLLWGLMQMEREADRSGPPSACPPPKAFERRDRFP